MRENNLQFHDISKPVCKIFPDDWITSIGSECFSLYSGVTPLHLRDDDRGEFLYLKVDDFNEPRNSQGLVYSFITFDKERNFNIETFNPGVIIFPKRGAAIFQNRVQVLKKEATVDPNLMVLKPKVGVHAQYFRYHLINFGLFNICDNSGIPQINNCHLYPLKFTYPQLTEQQKIAEIIDAIDKAIALTDTHITKLKKAKAGLLHDLLTRGIDEHGELRDYTRNPELFKRSPLGIIPKDWDIETIKQCIKTIEQGWSPDCESFRAEPGEWGVLKTTSVVWEGYQDVENKRLPSNLSPRAHYEVKPGDVLITRAGPNSRVGVVALVRNTQPKLILSDKLYRLVPNEKIRADFLTYALSSNQVQSYLSKFKTGLAESQTNISQVIVFNLCLPLPLIDEQEKIAILIEIKELKISRREEYLEKLKLLKKGLMSDLLTGRMRVKI